MLYDPNNPVVQLCANGIEIEHAGDLMAAGELYRQAWEKASCPLEACTEAGLARMR
ncbi:MAG TPA: hypothetical protein VNV35_03550 [Puia sp.]|jgi:hypothetical protein|nr:hypothetical protein [Puia sp.]